MFINIYKKLANLLARLPLFWKIFFSTIIALAVLLLLAFSLWQQFFADTIIAWVPDNAVFYCHFSLPAYYNNNSYDKLADAMLAQTSISSTTGDIIKREMAFVYVKNGEQTETIFLLRADSPKLLEKILKEKKISYRRLDNEHFAIGRPEIINSLIKNKRSRLIAKMKNKFSVWSTLSLYGEKQFLAAWLKDNSADYWQSALLRLTGNNDLFFNLFSDKEKNWGWLGEFRGRRKITMAAPVAGDLIFNLSDSEKILTAISAADLPTDVLQDVSEAKYSYGLDPADPAVNDLAKNKISAIVRSKNSTGTGWFWADNDVILKISSQPNTSTTGSLETMLKNILARQKPQDKKIQLHDGSSIIERVLNPEAIKFSSANGLIASNPELPVRIFYQTSTAGVAFSNNRDLLLATGTKPYNNDFISIKTKLLKAQGFWNYLKYFDIFEFYDNGQIILK